MGADLRPMSLGELLDRVFSLYRHHLWLFVGIMLLPALFAIAMSLFVVGLQGQPRAVQPGAPPAVVAEELTAFMLSVIIGLVGMFVVYWVVYAIALGATTFALSEVHLGHAATVRGAYQKMRGQFWRLMDVVFSVLLRIIGCVFVSLLLAGLLSAAAMRLFPPLGGGLTILAVLLGFGLGIALSVLIVVRYGVAVPVLVVEGARAREAMKRSVRLTKGYRHRVFLILLLTVVINYAAMFLFQGPFWVAGTLLADKGQVPSWLTSLSAIAGGLGGAFSGPLMMIALALLYFDLRMRKEAFDLQLMMATLDHKPFGGPPATPPERFR
ncbi:MAG: hypothetical protein ACE5HL_05035 [Terriglobia bacterium]